MKEMKKITDRLILAAVVLSIVHIPADELARFFQWNLTTRNIITVCGFLFDLTFTAEFAVRSFYSSRNGELREYLVFKRGWVDFISSVPLLILDSGLTLVFVLAFDSGAAPGTPVLIKAVYLSHAVNLLRMFRVVKLAGKTVQSESRMVQYHINLISSIALCTLIATLFLFNLIAAVTDPCRPDQRRLKYLEHIDGLKRVSDMNGISFRDTAHEILSSDRKILRIEYTDGQVINRVDSSSFKKYFNAGDYITVTGKGCLLYVALTDINRSIAVDNLKIFIAVSLIAAMISFIYAGIFRRNVSDVAAILNLGFRKRDYNLMVRIPDKNRDHEIFRLAKFYNDAYLPAKVRKEALRAKNSAGFLSADDLDGF